MALNRGFEYLKINTKFKKDNSHIVCVLDADGQIGSNVLEHVHNKFQDSKLGALNSSIRIRNRNHLLTVMQDIEFIVSARYLNYMRGFVMNNSFMGGNGQFMRYCILEKLEHNDGYIWKKEAMTEDLEIGIRILCLGWKCKQMLHGFIYQQGLNDFTRLYKQRIRWGWGTIQVLFWNIYSGKILLDNKISYISRFDMFVIMNNNMIYFCLFPLTVILTTLYVFNIIHLVFIVHPLILWINGIIWTIYIVIWVCITEEYRNWKILPYLLLYISYILVMSTTILVAVKKFLTCEHAIWVKTDREHELIENDTFDSPINNKVNI